MTTTSSDFERALLFVLGIEQGFSNHPADRGGPTNFGVTQGSYDAWRQTQGLPAQSVRLITTDEATRLYWDNYWTKTGGDKLPFYVALMVFDTAVNCGGGPAGRMVMFLQGALGVLMDGAVGPRTLAVLAERRPQDVIDLLIRFRANHYDAIVKHDATQRVFKRGWDARLTHLKEAALKAAAVVLP